MMWRWSDYGGGWGMNTGPVLFGMPLVPWFLAIALLELVLKGVALYRSARNGQKYWFVALIIFNTAGILPLVYLLLNRKKKK